MKENLESFEMLIHVDYSENYKSSQQNEIQSAYFGNHSFSLFTACAYYKDITTDDHKLSKIPQTITSECRDKDRTASITCVDKAISHVRSIIPNAIEKVHVFLDGCTAQFRSRFVFALVTEIQRDVEIIWHYNEAPS